MTEEELAIEQRAIAFAKAHRTEIAREIACKQSSRVCVPAARAGLGFCRCTRGHRRTKYSLRGVCAAIFLRERHCSTAEKGFGC